MTQRRRWFISDTHFGHERIIEICRPQFKSVEEMDEHMIERWNSVVGPDDLVYHLGDFSLRTEAGARARRRLNGEIDLIVGNHDPIAKFAKLDLFRRISMWRVFDEIGVTASHLPLHRSHTHHRGKLNVHGHVHNNLEGLEPFHFNVSVEVIDYTPIPFETVASWAAAHPFLNFTDHP